MDYSPIVSSACELTQRWIKSRYISRLSAPHSLHPNVDISPILRILNSGKQIARASVLQLPQILRRYQRSQTFAEIYDSRISRGSRGKRLQQNRWRAHTTAGLVKILGSANSFLSKIPRAAKPSQTYLSLLLSYFAYIRFRESQPNVRNYYLPPIAVSMSHKFCKSEISHSKTY